MSVHPSRHNYAAISLPDVNLSSQIPVKLKCSILERFPITLSSLRRLPTLWKFTKRLCAVSWSVVDRSLKPSILKGLVRNVLSLVIVNNQLILLSPWVICITIMNSFRPESTLKTFQWCHNHDPLPVAPSQCQAKVSTNWAFHYASFEGSFLIYCVPQTPLQPLFQTGQLSVQEAIYGYSALIFCQHFLNRLGSEYTTLSTILDTANPQQVEVLMKLKKRLRQETFTRDYVPEIVRSYPEVIRILYVNFAMIHYTSSSSNELKVTF